MGFLLTRILEFGRKFDRERNSKLVLLLIDLSVKPFFLIILFIAALLKACQS